MKNQEILDKLSKEDLIRLIELYAKNWLALDGVWFQSIEHKFGMDEAMFHDAEAWRRFTVIEARRLKEFLQLPERPGLSGLAKALELRSYSNINEHEIIFTQDKLVFRNMECRVQSARSGKQMPLHPCRPVGLIEYSGFARTIDERISCRCLSCYPEISDHSVSCAWEFRIDGDDEQK